MLSWLRLIFKIPRWRRLTVIRPSRKLARSLSTLLFLLPFCLCFGVSSGQAEEFLHKKNAKYLGWQKSEKEFTACDQKVLQIDDGKVEKTEEKCKKPPGPGPSTVTGKIAELMANKRMFTVKDSAGKVTVFFYPELAEGKGSVPFEKLQIGETVAVTAPIAGRADSVSLVAAHPKS